MSFLNPLFLIGLLTIAVPLLIYLLNIRKPKKVRFSTLTFFETLKSTALKRIKLKRWLLLALRCLAIVAMVIAASRPFIPPDKGWGVGNEPKAVAILIDNGPAMDQISSEGPYFEKALNIADALVNLAGQNDRFTIDVSYGESLSVPLLHAGSARTSLLHANVVNAGNYTSDRLEALANRLNEANEPNKVIYLITDLRDAVIRELEKPDVRLFEDIFVNVIKVGGAETVNIGFESVELEESGSEISGDLQMRVVVRNYSNRKAGNSFITLYLDDELISQQGFSIDPRSTGEFVFEIPLTDRRLMSAELALEGDDLEFDNKYFAGIQLPDRREILTITDESGPGSNGTFTSYLRPMLEIAGEAGGRFNVDFVRIDELDISNIVNYDAIVLDGLRSIPDFLGQSLIDHIQNGAGLLFLPTADGQLNNYNRFLRSAGSVLFTDVIGDYASFNPIDRMTIPTDGHPVLDTIFDRREDEELRLNVPEIFYYYAIQSTGRVGDFSILNTRTGNPLLFETRAGRGRIIVSAIGSDPGWSNFPVKPFFAPLYYRTVDYLARGEDAVLKRHELGEPFRYLVNNNQESPQFRIMGESIIPDSRQMHQGTELRYPGIEWMPGWLTIDNLGEDILIGINQHTMESELQTFDSSEMGNFFAEYFPQIQLIEMKNGHSDISSDLQMATFGREIWHWFVLITIILLLLESIISRHYKAESNG